MLNTVCDNKQTENRALLADMASGHRYDLHCQLLKQQGYVQYFSVVDGQLSIYRHPAVPVSPSEQIISINPHLGGPLKYFRQAGGAGSRIHVFEERIHQYANLCRNLAHWQLTDCVTPVCAGIWSGTGLYTTSHEGSSGTLYFAETKAVSECKETVVANAHQAYRLDDYLAKQHFTPTLIECGRQGFASDIIAGAEQTIKSLKPKLILVDSPWNDWLALVKQWVPQYKVYYTEAGRRNAAAFLLTL